MKVAVFFFYFLILRWSSETFSQIDSRQLCDR